MAGPTPTTYTGYYQRRTQPFFLMSGGTTDHGALGGLTDDDHIHYALVDGTSPFTGGIQIDVATGDPTIIFDTQAADKFTMGVDDSDNDYFKINSGATLADASDLVLTDGGILFLSDNANTGMTIGLTINQGANDDEILALKSSDVAHGMTVWAEADTYGTFQKLEGAAGGLVVTGLKDADGVAYGALCLHGYLGEAADTTKSNVGYGVIRARAAITDGGTTITDVGADGNLFTISSAANARFIFDAEGEMHSDAIIGVGDDWDEWDDLALAADLSRLPKAKFNEMMKYKADDFEKAGLLTLSTDKDGTKHAFIRHKAMLQFYACCFAEVGERLRRYESALLSLGVQPEQLEAQMA